MNSKITYLTYQTFPASTANSIQTISNIKYLRKADIDVKLLFPNRAQSSTSRIEKLQRFYDFKETFEIHKLDHNYPFKDYKKNVSFKKLRFHISHFFWSKKAVSIAIDKKTTGEVFFTRSDWIFYFLDKRKENVIFECHQVSKLRKFLINNFIRSKSSFIIFTNELLKNEFKVSCKNEVLPNAYDEELFNNHKISKNKNQIIFIGNLLRFNEDRNIKFLIETFENPRLKDYKLLLVGGPEDYKNKLDEKLKSRNIKNISLLGELSHSETINKVLQSSVGILINSSSNKHSTHHTSPLKYFEYLRAELKIVGVDFPAHRVLPFSEKINFFKEGSEEDLIRSIENAIGDNQASNINYTKYSLSKRIDAIIKIGARLEGLEPPTL